MVFLRHLTMGQIMYVYNLTSIRYTSSPAFNDLVLTFYGLNPTLGPVILNDYYRALTLLLLFPSPYALMGCRR